MTQRSAISASRTDRTILVAAGLIVLATVLAYLNSLSGALIYDDRVSVTENATIRHLWPVWPVLHPPAESGPGGRPVANLSFALSYALSGEQPWGYHVVGVAIHALAALALFGVVRRTLRQPALRDRFGDEATALAALVALLWAVHPLQTQTVTYVSQRTESLMALFYLLALYAFIRGTEGAARRWFPVAVGACLLGAMSKEIIATAPLMVLLYDRTFVAGTWAAAWRARWRLYVALAGTWAVLGVLLLDVRARGVGYGLGVPWFDYALTECKALVLYLQLGLWPSPLVFDRGNWLISSVGEAAPYAVVLATLAAVTLWALVRRPVPGFAGAWFFLILAPASSVIPVIQQPIAENRPYLPLAAVLAVAVLALRTYAGKQVVLILGAVAVCAGAIGTARRNLAYASEITIWADTADKAPGNPRAHYNLGVALDHANRRSEAIACYEAALHLSPDSPLALNNLGNALAETGHLPEALPLLERAVARQPDYNDAQFNLGNGYLHSDRPAEAISHYEASLRLAPDQAKVLNNLGMACLQTNRVTEAVTHLERAVALDAALPDPHSNLAVALARVGRVPEAIVQCETALRLRPDFPDARRNLDILRAMRAAGGVAP